MAVNSQKKLRRQIPECEAEAVQALTALGYGSAESLRAVKKVSVDCASVEDLLREALKNLL